MAIYMAVNENILHPLRCVLNKPVLSLHYSTQSLDRQHFYPIVFLLLEKVRMKQTWMRLQGPELCLHKMSFLANNKSLVISQGAATTAVSPQTHAKCTVLHQRERLLTTVSTEAGVESRVAIGGQSADPLFGSQPTRTCWDWLPIPNPKMRELTTGRSATDLTSCGYNTSCKGQN